MSEKTKRIHDLLSEGKSRAEIARRVGVSEGYVSQIVSKVKGNYFEDCALGRGITKERLIDRLLFTIAKDKMVPAILDDGVCDE